MRVSIAMLLASFLFAGCPTRDQVGGQGTSNSIAITAPTAATTYTNATLTIAVSTQHPATAPISILAGTTTVGTITPPSMSLQWDTTKIAEGTYAVTAQTTYAGAALTSAPVSVVVDRTAPTVKMLTPAPMATDVILAAPLTVVFSEPVLASTITPSFVSVVAGSSTLTTNVSLSPDGLTASISITSSAGLSLPEGLTGTLAVGPVTDLAGNHLTAPQAPWTWTVPDWIKLAPFGTYSAPVLAVGPDFHPAITYTQCQSGTNGCTLLLHVAVNDGQLWNDLGQPAPGANGIGAFVAVNSHAEPVVSWVGLDGTTSAALVATWTGTAWSASPPIDAAAGATVDATVLRLDSQDRPVVAFRQTTSGGSDVFVVRWTGSTWDTSLGQLGLTSAQTFDLALDDQGSPLVGVVDSSFNGVAVWNGTAWVKSSSAGASTPSLALDSMGNPVTLSNWRPQHLTNGSWLPSVSTAIAVNTGAEDPHLTSTSDHQPVIAWVDPSSPPGGIALARWTGSGWDQRSGLAQGDTNAPAGLPPAVVVDARGSIWIGWFGGLQAFVWMSNY